MAPLDEGLYIADDEFLATQIGNQTSLVKIFFNFVANILEYVQGASYGSLGWLICAIDFLSGRVPFSIKNRTSLLRDFQRFHRSLLSLFARKTGFYPVNHKVNRRYE